MLGGVRRRIGLTYLGVSLVSMGLFFVIFRFEQEPASATITAILSACLLAILFSLSATGLALRPIRDLAQNVRGIADRHLEQQIHVSSTDEIGELAQAFNQMSARLGDTIDAVSKERNRMAAMLSSMADGIVIVDIEGKVSLLNRASERILRLPPQDYIGRSLIEVVRDHELAQLVRESLGETSRRESRAKSVLPLTAESETREELVEIGVPRRTLRVLITPIMDWHTLVVLQDLTELRRAETVRREFVANVSHELRTPLASIKALVETLRDEAMEDPVAAQHFLTRMEGEVDELTQLVNELLELSRIESGQVAFRPEPTEILALIDQAADRLMAQAERAGVELAVNIPPDLPKAMADGERVQHALINLMHNAIKFTPPGGIVTVGAELRGAAVHLSVADTGVGIAAEDLPRIFERFYKADKSRSTGGTGLGLAIAKHIVQAHGGHIWAESVEGKGATFTFSLPVATGSSRTS